jgi:sporulation-control protein spo0M
MWNKKVDTRFRVRSAPILNLLFVALENIGLILFTVSILSTIAMIVALPGITILWAVKTAYRWLRRQG